MNIQEGPSLGQVVAAQATKLAGVRESEAGSMEPEWVSCAIMVGDRIIEFGEQLAAR